MAWRESRTSRKKLLLFACSIVLGVAAIAAIGSLGKNLERAVEEQAKSLLGADLVLRGPESFSTNEEALIKDIGGEQARETSFSTMIFFEKNQGTRLAQVRALSGAFPFYGRLETEPAEAAAHFRRPGGGALVDETLLRQYDANVGDTIRLGNLTTRIVGRLKKIPGETFALSTIAPRIFIAMDDLPRTGLLQTGSLAQYKIYFKFDDSKSPPVDISALVKRIQPQLDKFRLSHETVEQRKRELGRAMDNLYHFLSLVGFVALLLGGMGVASAIHVHVKQKLSNVAILRCLGSPIRQTFAIYLVQGAGLGAIGAIAGAGLGVAIQTVLPKLLADFLPFAFEFHTSWIAIVQAMAIGFCISLLFALLPLLQVRLVPPLAAIRVSFETQHPRRDPLIWPVLTCLAVGILEFAITQSRDWRVGLGFAAGLGVAFAALAGTSKCLVMLTKKFVPASLPFPLRQGVANLHRPQNRTLLLLLSLGLGTCLMMSLFLVQRTLLSQLVAFSGPNQADTILFDIQTAQKPGVIKLVESLGLPLIDQAPIVAMRLNSIKGGPIETILAGKMKREPGWALRREYRSTYSDHLRDGEKLVAGAWVTQVSNDTPIVPISLEREIARDLGVKLGDELKFDIQGVPVTTRVASLREVEWRRIQPNFFVVFPKGALDDAPAMHALVTRVGTSELSGRLQRETVQAFPNVSVIDLTLILKTVDSILTKISFVIRFTAMFTVLTALFVLVSALLTGRYQRMRESVLLRTLGASRAQIVKILAAEYLSLGVLAATTGILLAEAFAAALAKLVFQTPFHLEIRPLLAAFAIVPALTVFIGLLASRGVLDHPPLEVLRTEG
jgi:putative ABC transport system permease protein